ncbi:MAG: hypothetical protein ACYTGH_20605 [Planctomycetota bacterium]
MKPTFIIFLQLLVLLAVSGCGTPKVDEKHTSSQRYYLEKLLLTEQDLGGDKALQEQLVIAHNGYGLIDVGTLVLKPASKPAVAVPAAEEKDEPTEEPLSAQKKLISWLPTMDGGKDKPREGETLETMRRLKSVSTLAEMVKPKGSLEGYAEITFHRRPDSTPQAKDKAEKSKPEKKAPEGPAAPSPESAPEEGTPALLKVQYFLSHYPVDYLEAPASETAQPETASGESPEADSAQVADDADAPTADKNPTEGDDSAPSPPASLAAKPAEKEAFRPIILDSFTPELDDSSHAVIIRAKGLRVLISADAEDAQLAKACAEEITRRICREIDVNRRVIQQVRDSEEELKLEARLGAFWNHLGNRIDMDSMSYRFFKGKF